MTNNCLQPEHGIEAEVNKEEYFFLFVGYMLGKTKYFFPGFKISTTTQELD